MDSWVFTHSYKEAFDKLAAKIVKIVSSYIIMDNRLVSFFYHGYGHCLFSVIHQTTSTSNRTMGTKDEYFPVIWKTDVVLLVWVHVVKKLKNQLQNLPRFIRILTFPNVGKMICFRLSYLKPWSPISAWDKCFGAFLKALKSSVIQACGSLEN